MFTAINITPLKWATSSRLWIKVSWILSGINIGSTLWVHLHYLLWVWNSWARFCGNFIPIVYYFFCVLFTDQVFFIVDSPCNLLLSLTNGLFNVYHDILGLQNAEYTTQQIVDLSDKLETSDTVSFRSTMLDTSDRKGEDKLSRVTRDSCKTTMEVLHGFMSQIIKDRIFNQVCVGRWIFFG